MSEEITPFEAIRRTNPAGNEFWSSRDFAKVLGYADYRNFQSVIESARTACFNSGQRVEDHFVEVTDMIEIGKGGKRPVQTVMMSRYACYLVIQNADPAKEIVAHGQTYFALQTRRQELSDAELEEQRRLAIRSELRTHNSQLADAAKDAGVIEPRDYAIFQNHGYMGLYGGLGVQDIHRRKGLKKSEQILDHMGSTELAANLFRATPGGGQTPPRKDHRQRQSQPSPPRSRSQSSPNHQGTRRHHARGTAHGEEHQKARIKTAEGPQETEVMSQQSVLTALSSPRPGGRHGEAMLSENPRIWRTSPAGRREYNR